MKYLSILFTFFTLILFNSCEINSTVHFNKDYSGSTSTTIDLKEIMGFMGSMSDDTSEGASQIDSLFYLLEGKSDDDSLNLFKDSLLTILDEQGLHNFGFSRDGEYGLNLSYDFDDFDDLDVFDGEELFSKISEAIDGNDMNLGGDDASMFDSMPLSTSISKNGKWLEIDFFGGMTFDDYKNGVIEEARKAHIEEGLDEESFSAEDSFQNEQFGNAFISELFKFNTTYTFDRNVKEIQSDLPYKSENKSVTLTYNLGDLYDALEKENKVEVRIKLR